MSVKGERPPAAPPEVTQLLLAWSDGDQAALERLMPLVEAELRRLASAYMARERRGHVLQTTALVNEAYLRLIDWKNVQWQNRAHFFGAAAGMMRRVLVDVARRQRREKRGAGTVAVSLSNAADVIAPERTDVVALDDALRALTELDPRQARVVELRFFGGLTHEEAALVLDVSPTTVRRDWTLARAWLYRELNPGSAP
jgi:RNA polymerase sigma-70 factor (ECF subfamily)